MMRLRRRQWTITGHRLPSPWIHAHARTHHPSWMRHPMDAPERKGRPATRPGVCPLKGCHQIAGFVHSQPCWLYSFPLKERDWSDWVQSRISALWLSYWVQWIKKCHQIPNMCERLEDQFRCQKKIMCIKLLFCKVLYEYIIIQKVYVSWFLQL